MRPRVKATPRWRMPSLLDELRPSTVDEFYPDGSADTAVHQSPRVTGRMSWREAKPVATESSGVTAGEAISAGKLAAEVG